MYAWSIDRADRCGESHSAVFPNRRAAGVRSSRCLGKYAIVTTVVTSKTGPNCLAVLGIDPTTGMLSQVPGSPFVGDCGVLVADSSEPYIYDGSSGVTVYLLDETTGIPRPVVDFRTSGHGGFESRSDPLTQVGPGSR